MRIGTRREKKRSGRDTTGTENGRWVGTLCFNRKLTHKVVDPPTGTGPDGASVRTVFLTAELRAEGQFPAATIRMSP
jgi:hypothetical protein